MLRAFTGARPLASTKDHCTIATRRLILLAVHEELRLNGRCFLPSPSPEDSITGQSPRWALGPSLPRSASRLLSPGTNGITVNGKAQSGFLIEATTLMSSFQTARVGRCGKLRVPFVSFVSSASTFLNFSSSLAFSCLRRNSNFSMPSRYDRQPCSTTRLCLCLCLCTLLGNEAE